MAPRKIDIWPRVKLTVSLQKWSGPDQYFDGSVPNFLRRENGLLGFSSISLFMISLRLGYS